MSTGKNPGASLIDRLRSALRRPARVVLETGVFDEVVRQQVRSALESITHAPGAIDIQVHQGKVTLSGRVQAEEVRPIVDTVRAMTGVGSVVDRLHLRDPLQAPSRATPSDRHQGAATKWPWPVTIIVGAAAAIHSWTRAASPRGRIHTPS
jgi:hypothetical protein